MKGPENENLGEPEDINSSSIFCDELEKCVASVEKCKDSYANLDARGYMRSVREAVRTIDEAHNVGIMILEEKKNLLRMRLMKEKLERERIERENARIEKERYELELKRIKQENIFMRKEEEYVLKYSNQLKQLELKNEKNERCKMKKEEDDLKYILKERLRIERMNESKELLLMRNEEVRLRSVLKEITRLHELNKRRLIQEEKERKRKEALALARKIQKNKEIGLNELRLMRIEESEQISMKNH